MRPITAFFRMLPDTVTYKVFTGRDSYGDPSYAASVSYRARVVGRQETIRGFSGLEVVAEHTVYLGAAITAEPEDQITLSTGIVGSTQATALSPPILGATRTSDRSGVHHAVLYLG